MEDVTGTKFLGFTVALLLLVCALIFDGNGYIFKAGSDSLMDIKKRILKALII